MPSKNETTMNKKFHSLYISFAIYFLLITLFLSLPLKEAVVGRNLNELIQDNFERNVGIEYAVKKILNSEYVSAQWATSFPLLSGVVCYPVA